MALLFCDGFDDGLALLGKWNSFTGLSIVAGRYGSGARIANHSSYMLKQVAAADEHATFIVGFAMKFVVAPQNNNQSIFSLRSDNGNTTHMGLGANLGSNTLYVFRGGTTLASDTTTLIPGQWYYVEFSATLSDTVGSYELRINGQTRLTGSSTDTRNAGTKTVFDSIWFSSGVQNAACDFDDIYLCNGAAGGVNTFMGDVAIETILPTGNGSASQFVGSDADSVDNYQLVDEAAPSTADYVSGANVNDQDTYTFADLTRTAGSIRGIMVSAYANKSDAAARTIKNVARSGGIESTSAVDTLTTTWTPHSNMFETNPNGGGSWTIPAVNNAEFGVKVDS